MKNSGPNTEIIAKLLANIEELRAVDWILFTIGPMIHTNPEIAYKLSLALYLNRVKTTRNDENIACSFAICKQITKHRCAKPSKHPFAT